MIIREETLIGDLQGVLLTPERTTSPGVVVLSGSSGRVDVAHDSIFTARGAIAMALRWFGGEGQVPLISEVPLETFTRATDRLIQAGCDGIAYLGTSRGAEAALLVADRGRAHRCRYRHQPIGDRLGRFRSRRWFLILLDDGYSESVCKVCRVCKIYKRGGAVFLQKFAKT